MNDTEKNKDRKREIWFLYKHPVNFFAMQDCNTCSLNNSTCGDQITVYAKIDLESIKSMSFQGYGCSLLFASASIAISHFEHSSKDSFINAYNELCEQLDNKLLNEHFSLFANTTVYRKKCILLPWQAFIKAIS